MSNTKFRTAISTFKRIFRKRLNRASLSQFGWLGVFVLLVRDLALVNCGELDRLRSRNRRYQIRLERAITDAIESHRIAFVKIAANDAEYETYLRRQIERTLRQSSRFSIEKRVRGFFVKYLLPLKALDFRASFICRAIREALPETTGRSKVLAVGCRDVDEIFGIERVLSGTDVIGLDLFSASKRIGVGDIHSIPFGPNEFEAVVASHVLEHALWPDRALTELFRVLMPGGILAIEVPVSGHALPRETRFIDNDVDLWDYGSARNLISRIRTCTNNACTVVLEQDLSGVARVAVTKM